MNMWYGYRNSLSTSSERAWHLAQEHNTKSLFKYGLLMIIIGVFTGYTILTDTYFPTMFMIEMLVLLPLFTILMILSTHNYLKRKLNK